MSAQHEGDDIEIDGANKRVEAFLRLVAEAKLPAPTVDRAARQLKWSSGLIVKFTFKTYMVGDGKNWRPYKLHDVKAVLAAVERNHSSIKEKFNVDVYG